MKCPALGCAAFLGIFGIRTSEPGVGRSVDAVIPPFREHQMGMRIVLLTVRVAAVVNGECIRQMLVVRQRVRELAGEVDLLLVRESAG